MTRDEAGEREDLIYCKSFVDILSCPAIFLVLNCDIILYTSPNVVVLKGNTMDAY